MSGRIRKELEQRKKNEEKALELMERADDVYYDMVSGKTNKTVEAYKVVDEQYTGSRRMSAGSEIAGSMAGKAGR